ncbi:hypothetical protein K8089_09750 [Aequorivita sp. F47161]|uniref:Uncharacterized protein n=1 Tax=Aequorivita vitellina TaxID=2874475 RepID=A0A9X1QTR3_9FLAO|nr:hypothetical protein [Aequorivita vitellina]MCG2419306.1 hypothetical protein [Aequorivita vitellina]
MKTIHISGANGKCNEISGLENCGTTNGTVLLKDVNFEDQTELWTGYGTPLEKEGTVTIEEKDENNKTVKTWKLKNSRALQFQTSSNTGNGGPSFKSIELSHEGFTVEGN